MGYCTDFQLDYELTHDPAYPEPTTGEIQSALEEISGYGWEEWSETFTLLGAKWYDEQDHMFELSKRFPQVIFHLHGDGDNSDDVWEEHWQSGKVQICMAEIPPYDEKQMVPYVHTDLRATAEDPPLDEESISGLTELL